MVNWAEQVEPEKLYPVRYTTNHQRPEIGRVYNHRFKLKGKDMTENQIIEYITGAV